MAEKVGIKQSNYSRMENGSIQIYVEYVINFCEKNLIRGDFMLFGAGPMFIEGKEPDDFIADPVQRRLAELEKDVAEIKRHLSL